MKQQRSTPTRKGTFFRNDAVPLVLYAVFLSVFLCFSLRFFFLLVMRIHNA